MVVPPNASLVFVSAQYPQQPPMAGGASVTGSVTEQVRTRCLLAPGSGLILFSTRVSAEQRCVGEREGLPERGGSD